MATRPNRITVIFDGDCLLCRRSVHWLRDRHKHIAVDTVAAADPAAVAGYGRVPGYGDNMVVVGDDGRIWVGPPDAYLVVMWAVRGTRMLSYLLSLPLLKPAAAAVFRFVAGNRHLIGGIGGDRCAQCAT